MFRTNYKFHEVGRTNYGDFDDKKVYELHDQFLEMVFEKRKDSIARAVVRSMLPCNYVYVLDSESVFVVGEKMHGTPQTVSIDQRPSTHSIDEVVDAAKWTFGFEDAFVVQFPATILNQSIEMRKPTLEAIADSHICSEINRVERQMSIIQINPIFGPAAYAIDPRLAFVLMPFTNELTMIYSTFVKPTIESEKFGLVCRRADDIRSNKAVIQDIWKSICEARLVVADLTGLNPNVMYELGIAHTLGKETVLIYQRGADVKFPFDLTHIRRIEYENNAVGGKRLEDELRQTLASVLTPTIKLMN